jgi:hypothetical protein
MPEINSTRELKEAILLLQTRQSQQLEAIQWQVNHAIENFNPVNLVMGMIKGNQKNSGILYHLFGTSLGLVGGYISKKILIGKAAGFGRKVWGNILQIIITGFLSNPEKIHSFVGRIENLFTSKEKEPS